jgi:hypothetical protein
LIDRIKNLRANINALFELIESLHSSTEIQRSLTYLKESRMELGRVLHELGSLTPYRHSKNPSNDVLINTSELQGSPAIDNADTSPIRLIKSYRNRIDQLETEAKDLIELYKNPENIWIEEHLKESAKLIIRAGMWLGVELERVKDNRDMMHH